ncbi:hypothetical protein PIIN_08213 [Serendipita indica DSM 11827]|uniref:Uncharacterized protein n=1 Tax=Serendipita indica (strain DSM 11827) TaxID=1109443 RepID=G4TSG7_SERID|nr:hypothetical protein PIIN_08213 [Serendipita indica DSM 11827]
MAVAFSPDGSKIVSGSSDNTLRLWDVATGEPLGEPIQGHKCDALSVAYSPLVSQIASGPQGHTIILSPLPTGPIENVSKQEDGEPVSSISIDKFPDPPLRFSVPGFTRFSLSRDGWVESSGRYLFWVPPENRHGLQYPHLLTMPTSSPLRATKLDFTHFHCGQSWTNDWKDTTR